MADQVVPYPELDQKINELAEEALAAFKASNSRIANEWGNPLHFVRQAVSGFVTKELAETIIMALSEEQWHYALQQINGCGGMLPRERDTQAYEAVTELVWRRAKELEPNIWQLANARNHELDEEAA